jgi:hypothetical protein
VAADAAPRRKGGVVSRLTRSGDAKQLAHNDFGPFRPTSSKLHKVHRFYLTIVEGRRLSALLPANLEGLSR